jgi:hypothetical protein
MISSVILLRDTPVRRDCRSWLTDVDAKQRRCEFFETVGKMWRRAAMNAEPAGNAERRKFSAFLIVLLDQAAH